MENYFNYFTEIEDHFQRRRGTTLLLSTLDWALIETWKDAGLPLEAVLRGIDSAFDKYDARPRKTRKVNSLAYCTQEILAAAEDMKEAAVGAVPAALSAPVTFDYEMVAGYIAKNAKALSGAALAQPAQPAQREVLTALQEIKDGLQPSSSMEDVERRLSVLEEKLFAALLAATPEPELLEMRTQAEREIAPYRSKMPGAQIAQLQRQYLHKRLFEQYSLPRLSLFYM